MDSSPSKISTGSSEFMPDDLELQQHEKETLLATCLQVDNVNYVTECGENFCFLENDRRSSGGNLLPSPRRNMYHGGNNGGNGGNMSCGQNSQQCSSQIAGSSRGAGSYGQHYHHHHYGGGNGGNGGQVPNNSSGLVGGPGSNNGPQFVSSSSPGAESKWGIIRGWIRGETRTFFGLQETSELKEEWLSRRKRFASRRYSERNVDSMPPPSPYQAPCLRAAGGGPAYQQYQQSHSGQFGQGFDAPDNNSGRMDSRMGVGSTARTAGATTRSSRRTRKKDNIFVVYWNLLRWIFWVS